MKLDYYDIKKEINKCNLSLDYNIINQIPIVGVHHHHDWDHGYESGTGYNGKKREFYADTREIFSYLYDYIKYNSINECIVAPFYRINQFACCDNGDDLFNEIRCFLRSNDIHENTQAGIKISLNNNWDVIEMLLEGGFRGISELCILFPEHKVLIAPNHHFDLPFITRRIDEEKVIVKLLLQNYPCLCYYENEKRL